MSDDTPKLADPPEAGLAQRLDLARQLDALMAAPPRPWPAIFVVGDDAVSSITPPKRGPDKRIP